MKIDGIKVLNNLNSENKINSKKENENIFSNYFKTALDKVNDLQNDSQKYKDMISTGNIDNIHEAMIAGEKASVALQFTINVQNKVIEAYKEIMRLQI